MSVVITAMAPVTPIGTGCEEFSAAMAAGTRGIGVICSFDTKHYPVRLGAEARMNGKVIVSRPQGDRKEIFLELAFEQLQASGRFDRYAPEERVCLAGAGIDYLRLEDYAEEKPLDGRWQPYSVNTKLMIDRICGENEIAGSALVNVSACVASSQAIGQGFRRLKNGDRKIVIAGGVDSMLNPLHYIGFYKLGALSTLSDDPAGSCRPYDLHRQGLVLGEGATFFTLEDASAAEPGTALAEICGYGSSMDAYMITDPRPDGAQLAEAAQRAIDEAGITADDIDCVHTHGTGTLKNDIMECKALERIFGPRYRTVPVFSLKAQVGHLIAACGAAETAAVIDSLTRQVLPATQNFATPDPGIPLNVLRQPMKMDIEYVLKLNAAFGGQNTALVFRKPRT